MYQGEKTLLETRPTRLISFKYYVVFVLAEVVALLFFASLIPPVRDALAGREIFGWSYSTIIAVVLAILGFVSLITAELKRASTEYIITDNKIIRRDGILNKRTMMVPYTQLEKVDLNQSLLQRVLRIGTLNIDTGDDSISIDMVPRPAKVQELLSQRMGRRAFQR